MLYHSLRRHPAGGFVNKFMSCICWFGRPCTIACHARTLLFATLAHTHARLLATHAHTALPWNLHLFSTLAATHTCLPRTSTLTHTRLSRTHGHTHMLAKDVAWTHTCFASSHARKLSCLPLLEHFCMRTYSTDTLWFPFTNPSTLAHTHTCSPRMHARTLACHACTHVHLLATHSRRYMLAKQARTHTM